jgi:hypothetical protein
MYSEQGKVKDALAVDRRREAVGGMSQVSLGGKSGVLSEPMMTYGFCKPRTESLEKMGYTSELVGSVAPGQGLLRKS